MYFFSHLNPSIRMMLRNFGIRIPPRQVTLYQTVCIWLLHFFLLGGNSIASKSPRTNSDLPSSRQHEENTEDKTEAGVKNPQTLYFTLWLYYSRQWSSINCDLYKKPVRIRIFRMRSDERQLKLSCCIVWSLINATIQGFHRDEELMLKDRRLFAKHSPC